MGEEANRTYAGVGKAESEKAKAEEHQGHSQDKNGYRQHALNGAAVPIFG
mgnify:CR=1 FL=1